MSECVCDEIICEYHRWPGVPFADMTLIYNHQGWMLQPRLSLSPSVFDYMCVYVSHKLWPGALYLATLGTEWHHTAPRSNSIVSGINGRLMFEDLAAVHKGGTVCLC